MGKWGCINTAGMVHYLSSELSFGLSYGQYAMRVNIYDGRYVSVLVRIDAFGAVHTIACRVIPKYLSCSFLIAAILSRGERKKLFGSLSH